MSDKKAKAWLETVVIPTYETGPAEKNPVFLEGRVYQGSSGSVYPYQVIESVSDVKTNKAYRAAWLENEYLKIMILPELGGRVQMAYDKIAKRHFIYYNHVIKPALVGLTGPWISGGIEFNWPQHHRPSTFLPVDCKVVDNPDGSVTVWVSEMEKMTHQKGMAGITLYPGRAYLEVKGVVYNRTPLPQTFLWWANPAVHVNNHYQSVFPPDINAVFDHGKRAVSTFPIASGTYYKVDYSAGVDISNYKNIKVPTSYMAVNSKYDFEGGYENDSRCGMLHVANHHVAPGKKQWTWGNGDFGKAWDRNLTDHDGPYIELMAGVYTENQPDFSWIMPGEEKEFTQYFMPYRELGIVKQASKDIILNVDQNDKGKVRIRLMTTSKQIVKLQIINESGMVIRSHEYDLDPRNILDETIDLGDYNLDNITVKANRVSWHSEPDEIKRIPDAARPALAPGEIKTIEQLYLTGLHLEQYRHATWNPTDYYEEGLRRDPEDVRCNNSLGLWYLRRGVFDTAEKYFRVAVRVLQRYNPNPYDGEPFYNLGLCLKYQERFEEAYDCFYKATWNGAWQNSAYFSCAQISVIQDRMEDALTEVERSLCAGNHNHNARALKAIILRKLGLRERALAFIDESLDLDLFNYVARFERYFLTGDKKDVEIIKEIMHGNVHNYYETALDYAQAGLWDECIGVIRLAETATSLTPMAYYYLGWAYSQLGDIENSRLCFKSAEKMDSAGCFPNRLEDISALRCAMSINPKGAKAYYYIGCLYYDKRQYDLAVDVWESSLRIDATFPATWRCLALASFNKRHNKEKALEYMERAFSLDDSDPRVLMELNQLYKITQKPHSDRLSLLDRYQSLVARRDDMVLERITLLNLSGRYEEAIKELEVHHFHPWEGGEGKVPAQYQFSRMELAKQIIGTQDKTIIKEAVILLEECLVYPHNLGEGKLYQAQENDFYYLLGKAYEVAGDIRKARRCWRKAAEGLVEPNSVLYYNDAKPDKLFYAGLAIRESGEKDKANGVFHKLINYGEKHLFETVKMDYFAVSMPDLSVWDSDLQLNNTILCEYLLALGFLGLGNMVKGEHYLAEVERLDINHQGARAIRSLIKYSLL
ncbi:MAG: DUF5107 domain-containing protein [Bacteroidales bacterium]|nr:DUF5107 domain-containing protein [Bacteroidales bacterium]